MAEMAREAEIEEEVPVWVAEVAVVFSAAPDLRMLGTLRG